VSKQLTLVQIRNTPIRNKFYFFRCFSLETKNVSSKGNLIFFNLRNTAPPPSKIEINNCLWSLHIYFFCTHRKTVINKSIPKGNEAIALCSDEFSDIAPLSGASVAFSTLEGRPSAYDFEGSEELKDWVTATDIRLTLNRLNTFGDDIFGDPKVLRSYFYAISDISIGGRYGSVGVAFGTNWFWKAFSSLNANKNNQDSITSGIPLQRELVIVKVRTSPVQKLNKSRKKNF
jgi:hypothetical protein